MKPILVTSTSFLRGQSFRENLRQEAENFALLCRQKLGIWRLVRTRFFGSLKRRIAMCRLRRML
jgi:hypothetical protein